jgi:ZIP family zinc transporter/zinc and cadmium transporter
VEIICSLVAALIAIIGAMIFIIFNSWANKHSNTITNIIAGMMLTIACLHLIPEGLIFNYNGMLYSLLGFIFMLILQLFSHNININNINKYSVSLITSLALHSVIDGIILSITFQSGIHIGFLSALVILLHKLSDGLTISGILLHRNNSKRTIFYLSILISLLTPLSTILSILCFKSISMKFLGALFCIVAGTFIFIATTELIPEMLNRKNDRLKSFIYFILGVLITILAG